MARLLVGFALIFALATPATAQQLTLHIVDGLVTLEATNVPVRQILNEWAKIGGTTVVGADKITGAPVTMKFAGVPERQALDTVLRNVAGFMAATRLPSATPGASVYDRILILPSAPVSTGTNASARPTPGMPNGMAGTQRNVRVPPRPPNLPPQAEPDEPVIEEPDPADTGVPQQPVFSFPGPQGQPGTPANPVFVPVPNTGSTTQVGTPVITLTPNPNGQPTIYNFTPGQTAPPPATTPFGVVGSPTPGVIQQPPQPNQPPGARPPG
jgi:hypothetical protein